MPFLSINEENTLDIAEGNNDLGLERSKWGSITQLRSPPNIREWVSISGREDIKLFAKVVSSQLGAYMFTKSTGMWNRTPETITYLPLESEMTFECLKAMFLLISMETPLALLLKFEKKD